MRGLALVTLAAWLSASPPAQGCERAPLAAAGEAVLQEMAALFGLPPPPLPTLIIDRAGEHAADHYQAGRATLVVRCQRDDGADVSRVARHEYAHHYLHQINADLPGWLDEGMASYFEMSAPGRTGRINPGRLAHFISLVKRNRLPTFAELLDFSANEAFADANLNYSIGWALVFALLHPENPQEAAPRRAALRALLFADWKKRTAKADFLAALRIDEVSLARWEQAWIEELWRLRNAGSN